MNRRDEARAATLAEIKRAARRLLVSGGVAAIGLRAVAREVNLTAPALYRYFPSHEALLTELVADLYDELTTALMELSCDGEGDLGAQLYLLANGLRDWALAHPAEFALLFGTTVPNPEADDHDDTPGHQAAMRFGALFKELVAQIWHAQPFPYPPDEVLGTKLVAQLSDEATAFHGMPPGAIYLGLTYWTRLYGLICMEVFGQLHWVLPDAAAYFEAQLYEIGLAMGLDCPVPE
ncbi:TetR/AcrR family transcriptional regulator [Kribbella sp. NPDC056951]|uniref:TetR/AcrR family transcriptional regulator n=1 Tax=Kribbella yunnanensis TaxID=190194 RepID=A0ABN2G8Z3_9ACTN